ncbi:MAG: fluoride efflux transporter CrcB [Roseovarius sp.]|nr:fluoride efflux transporter CrcB [Roseovarius sp.]MCY4291441.1 fluoride efflux transporter CrcB [Roseovarius sp.]
MFVTFIQIGIGGAIGAMLRYAVGVAAARHLAASGFPLGTIMVNVLGSMIMGFFAVYATHRGIENLNPFVMAGVLGGFTTFSAFSLEAFALYEKGEIALAVAYVAASVFCSIGALIAAVLVARALWS